MATQEQTTNEPSPAPAANGTPPSTAMTKPAAPPPVLSEREEIFRLKQRTATAFAQSDLVPEAYRGNVPNVLIAMEMAERIDASIFAVMQNLDIIHGRPSFRAQFLIATVNASGKFTPLRFRWEGKPGDDLWGCRCVAKDTKTGEECVGPLVNIALAKAEGWFQRNGSKWKTLPELMISYRAAGFWTRIYAPEMSLGMQTAEEVVDTIGIDVTHARPASDTKALEAALLSPSPSPKQPTQEQQAQAITAASTPTAAPAKEPKARTRRQTARTAPTQPAPAAPHADDDGVIPTDDGDPRDQGIPDDPDQGP